MLFPDTFPDALLETQATQIESYLDQMNRNNRFCLDFFLGMPLQPQESLLFVLKHDSRYLSPSGHSAMFDHQSSMYSLRWFFAPCPIGSVAGPFPTKRRPVAVMNQGAG